MNKIDLRGVCWWPCWGVVVLLAGCGKTQPPQFQLNMVSIAQQQLPRDQQQELANLLEAMFGTPDDPFVLPDAKLNQAALEQSAGAVRSDQFGRDGGLYRRHCVHCHGITGDGLGPTALVLNPYPRDYRQGKFKFKSTERPAKPTEHDLEMILRLGVQGTAMPSFDLLPDDQIKSLVEYVKYLSIRGETEIRLIAAMADLSEGAKLETTRSAIVDEILKPVVESWTTASQNIINPEAKPDIEAAVSIAQGRELFYGTKANCVKCHGPAAMGDGQTTDYDDWNKPIAEMAKSITDEREKLRTDVEIPAAEKSATWARLAFDGEVLEYDALPARTAKPRNLRQGIYRGGRRPLDMYRRMHAGINGAPMPGVGPTTPGGQGTLSPNEIWALVDYVLSLPYEAISEPPRSHRTMVNQARF